MSVTYEQIKPIIKSETLNGQQMTVQFQAPGQAEPMQAISALTPDTSQVVKNVGKQAVKTGIISQVIRAVSGLVGGAIGGAGGSVARSATSQVGHAATRKQTDMSGAIEVKDTPEARQAAVVLAFESVKGFYNFDEGTKTWSCTLAQAPQS